MTLTLSERRQLEDQAQFSRLVFRDPEKHYVRRNAWLKIGNTVRDRLGGQPLRYFSLCGGVPLDVLLLFREGILQPNWQRPNVAICDVETGALTAAGRALSIAGYGPATKLRAEVEELVLADCVPHRRFVEMLPFHVYNLDFTKQIFYHREPIQTTMLESIERIIELQSEHEQDFELFLTSRSHPKEINPEAAREFRSVNRKLTTCDNRILTTAEKV